LKMGNLIMKTTVNNWLGKRVIKLLVIERAANKVEGNAAKPVIRSHWLCQCDCGNKVIVSGHSLSKAYNGKGGAGSCGCALGRTIKHGKCGSTEYRIWHMMLQRCTNANNGKFKNYGGRGITVCEKWQDFKGFYADMGDRPEGMTLDRIDNEKGYFKANCRWASRKQQSNNRSNNLLITYQGKKQTLQMWADELGLKKSTLINRVKRGWTIERALSTSIVR